MAGPDISVWTRSWERPPRTGPGRNAHPRGPASKHVPDLTVFTHPTCREHDLPDGQGRGTHVERPQRLDAVRKGLDAFDGDVRYEQADLADRDRVTRVHDPDQVRTVETACDTGTFVDADTYARPESWEAALASAGAAVQVAQRASRGEPAFSLARPPGHHATATKAMGFCLFNNVAIAAEAMMREHRRVAIVDVDVHHGNGTQELFYDRDDVLYVSLHQSPFYPGTGMAHETGTGSGEGYTVNLPVPESTSHAGWTELVDRVVVPVLESFEPGVLLVSAGYDAHRLDPIGGLNLVAGTFHRAIQRFRELTPNVGAVLEGGYSLEALEICATATAAALAGEADPVKETIVEGVNPWGMLRSGVENYHAGRWPVKLT